MRIVFMGTPQLAATVLAGLAERHEIVGVFTRPDAVRGRGSALEASEVKKTALVLGLPVFTPARFDREALSQLEELSPDAICVVAYGMLLPKEVIDLPLHGCLNVHASLLPRWRGAAPIERAILAGDACTGVSIMQMDEGLDTGCYCEQRRIPLEGKDMGRLENEIALVGTEALLSVLTMLEEGQKISWIEQDEALATYASKIEKRELDLDPELTAEENERKVRASSEAHAARVIVAGRTCAVIGAQASKNDYSKGVVTWQQKRLYLGCAQGALEVKQVKPAGKNTMDARAFAAGIQNIKSNALRWERL